MRILVAAGGTGGHVYPALAIVEAIAVRRPDVEFAFVGGKDGFERSILAQAGVTFTTTDEVASGPLHGVPIPRALWSAGQIARGVAQAYGLIGRRKPSAILLTGGWEGFPVALAAWLRRVPSLVFLPDIEPALSIKALRYVVTRVAATVEASAKYFNPGQMVATGYPLRAGVLNATREAAIAHFGLEPGRRTLLIFGGSRGARSLNDAVLLHLDDLLDDGWQVIHVSGALDGERVTEASAALTRERAAHYHPFAYLHGDMGLALAAADLCLCRSGASVLGESPYFGLPSILVPYPYAWRYQKVNADWLASRGAAIVVNDADLQRDLLTTIRDLANDAERLQAMGVAARALRQPDGAWNAARELLTLAGGSQGRAARQALV